MGGPNMASRWCCRDAIFWAPNPQRRVACRKSKCWRYSNILAAVLVYAVSQLRSSSVKGSVDFRVA